MRPQKVTDEEILAVARKVFIEQGCNTAVESIAKELGLSQPAIFKRFGTKRNLLIESIRLPKDLPWRHVVEVLPDDRSFKEQLNEVAGAMSAFLTDIIPIMKVVFTSDITPKELMHDASCPLPLLAITCLTEWLERCHKKGLIRKTNYRIAAMSLMGIFQLEKMAALFEENFELDEDQHQEFLDEVILLVWKGLKNEE